MRVIGLTQAKANLTAFVEEAQDGPVVITKNGKAVAVLIAPENDEALERLLLTHSKQLKILLDKRQKRIQNGEYLSHNEIWSYLES